MILLDSSVLIEMFRKKDKEKTLFYKLSLTDKIICISSITYYEVGIGNRESHFEYWEKLSKNLTIIPFDKACSVTAISIYLDLLKMNKEFLTFAKKIIKQNKFRYDKKDSLKLHHHHHF